MISCISIILYYQYVLKMVNIAYFIKKVYSKNQQSIPINIFLTKTNNDLMFFYNKLTYGGAIINHTDDNEKTILINNYIKAKRIKNAMNRFCYLYKLKKASQSVKNDLFFNSLDIIKKNQRIELYSNNTIYYFRLSDIVNIWVSCLTKCENMFCTPIEMKNPYTNITFSKCNLHNIYQSLLYSNFHMSKWILLFFEAEFDLNKFAYDNYALLKDVAINDFMENGTVYEKFENILNMMHEYREYLNYIVINTPYSFRQKSSIVKKLSPYLNNYLYGEYSCHPLRKKRCSNRAKRGLKAYFEDHDDIQYYRQVPLNLSGWDSESTLSSRITRILTRSREDINVPSITQVVPTIETSNVITNISPNSVASSLVNRPNINLTVREATNRAIPTTGLRRRHELRRRNSTTVTPENTPIRQTPIHNNIQHVNYRNGSIFNLNLNSAPRSRTTTVTSDPFTPSFTLNRSPNSESSTNNNTGSSNFRMRMFNR